MATIGQLLDRLESQIRDLDWARQDSASAHAAGWMPLARASGQAITLLPLGGRSDHVKAGIRNVLTPLAHGPGKSDTDVISEPQLVELATTVGAISDSLAGILRWGPRPEQVGTPALELEAELLSAVHVAARWSRAAVEMQCPVPPRPPLAMLLGDLIVVTEPFALIPPQRRASTLEDLAFVAPSSPGLEGAVAAWAETAGTILDDRYRVSGWALQTVAADLALLALEVRRQFVDVGSSIEAAASTVVSDTLKLAVRSWRQAAAWPPHVRLGGQNADLRVASRDLREGVTTDPVSTIAQARGLLAQAVRVGAAHARCMSALVNNHELWVHTRFLVPKVPYERGWIREPSWSGEGRPLLEAADAGKNAIHRALLSLGPGPVADDFRSERPRWAPQPNHNLSPVTGHTSEHPRSCEIDPLPTL